MTICSFIKKKYGKYVVKKYVITSKNMESTSWCHVMTPKLGKYIIIAKKTCHKVKQVHIHVYIYHISQNVCHNLKTSKLRYDVKSMKWRQEVCHKVKTYVITLQSTSWRQKVHHAIRKYEEHQPVWKYTYVMISKGASLRQKVCHSVNNMS